MSKQFDSEDPARHLEAIQKRMQGLLGEYGVETTNLDEDDQAISAIEVTGIAARRCMLDIFRDASDETQYLKQLQRERLALICQLWLSNRLDTPWLILIDREFPGRPVTTADFEKFAGEASDLILQENHLVGQQHQARQEITDLLMNNHYPLEVEDVIVIVRIASVMAIFQAGNTQHTEAFNARQVEELRVQAREAIDAEATTPEHLAWNIVIDHCFRLDGGV